MFTREIIKDALVALGDEMFNAMLRTSMSPIIYEATDFAVGATDARGRAAGPGQRRDRVPGHARRARSRAR